MKKQDRHANLDLLGQRFGKLTAIAKVEGKTSTWVFKCDCGNEVVLKTSRILGGQKSCGCLRKEVAKEWVNGHTTHGESKTKLYRKYRSILDRCYHNSGKKYERYGGRGITVCDEWKEYSAFREWALANGYDETLPKGECTIDRIDVNGNYEPNNCRWVDSKVQAMNKRHKDGESND